MTGSRRGISFFFILSVLFSFSFIYSIVNFSSLIKGKLGFGLRLGLRNWVRVGGYSHISWMGLCRWVRESPTLYQTKFCKFCDPIPE